jgi:hypothetical protein
VLVPQHDRARPGAPHHAEQPHAVAGAEPHDALPLRRRQAVAVLERERLDRRGPRGAAAGDRQRRCEDEREDEDGAHGPHS